MAKPFVNKLGQTIDLDTGAVINQGQLAPGAGGDPTQAAILALIQQMQGGGQQQGGGMAQFLAAMNQPQEQIHRGMGGGVISDTNPQGHAGGDPFTNGFFGGQAGQQASEQKAFGPAGGYLTASPETRQKAMADTRFATAGMPGALPMFGQLSNVNPDPSVPMAPSNGTMRPIPGGFEGMINPRLPDAQKYGDQNFWSAIGNVGGGWLPGAVARDETGQQFGRPKAKKKSMVR